MAEPKKKPDTTAKSRRQSKWPKKRAAADSVLLLRQIEAMEKHTDAMNRLADKMASRRQGDHPNQEGDFWGGRNH